MTLEMILAYLTSIEGSLVIAAIASASALANNNSQKLKNEQAFAQESLAKLDLPTKNDEATTDEALELRNAPEGDKITDSNQVQEPAAEETAENAKALSRRHSKRRSTEEATKLAADKKARLDTAIQMAEIDKNYKSIAKEAAIKGNERIVAAKEAAKQTAEKEEKKEETTKVNAKEQSKIAAKASSSIDTPISTNVKIDTKSASKTASTETKNTPKAKSINTNTNRPRFITRRPSQNQSGRGNAANIDAEKARQARIIAEVAARDKAARAKAARLAAEEAARVKAEKLATEKLAATLEGANKTDKVLDKTALRSGFNAFKSNANEKARAEAARLEAEKRAAEQARLEAEKQAKIKVEKEAAEKARIEAEKEAAEKARIEAEKEAAAALKIQTRSRILKARKELDVLRKNRTKAAHSVTNAVKVIAAVMKFKKQKKSAAKIQTVYKARVKFKSLTKKVLMMNKAVNEFSVDIKKSHEDQLNKDRHSFFGYFAKSINDIENKKPKTLQELVNHAKGMTEGYSGKRTARALRDEKLVTISFFGTVTTTALGEQRLADEAKAIEKEDAAKQELQQLMP